MAGDGADRDDLTFAAGGIKRQMRVFRLPDALSTTAMTLTRTIRLVKAQDNPLYLTMIQEDGFQAWSSPVYVFD